jgi:hypothetical protein
MRQHKIGSRAEFRQQEDQRTLASECLAIKFKKLKALKVELAYFNGDGASRSSSQIKYQVNLENAHSVFRFNCPNNECVRGDFDLSAELAAAVAGRRKLVTGELTCQGWRNRNTVDTVRCQNILRYKFTLKY